MNRIRKMIALLLVAMLAAGSLSGQELLAAKAKNSKAALKIGKTNDTKKGKDPVFNFKKRTVRLNSGYDMPLNGIGTYSLEDDVCVKSVSEALKRGVRLIDTDYMYDKSTLGNS